MKIILNPYVDPGRGMDWPEQTPIVTNRIDGILKEFNEPVKYDLTEHNFGGGADWPVIAVNVATIASVGFFAIPEAHKRIRESLEEWGRIGASIKKLIKHLSDREVLVAEPIEVLFLDACKALLEFSNAEDATFESYSEVASIGSYGNIGGLYEFIFSIETQKWSVQINGAGELTEIKKV